MPAKKAPATKSTAKKRKSTAPKKSTSTKTRAASSKSKAKTNPKAKTGTKAKTKSKTKAGEQEVTLDRRRKADRRDESKTDDSPAKQPSRRAKVQRRRQIDPTTCERDYSEQEVEFMNAMDDYKRTSGRMFPTCSEVLEVIRKLGYVQLTPAEMAIVRPEPVQESEGDDQAAEQSEETELEVAVADF